jgi:hypothetical protein
MLIKVKYASQWTRLIRGFCFLHYPAQFILIPLEDKVRTALRV